MPAITVLVTVRLFEQDGPPLVGATVTARADINDINAGYVTPDTAMATTDANGSAVLALFPNKPIPAGLGLTGASYRFKAVSAAGKKVLDVIAQVPNSNCFLDDIAPYEILPGVSAIKGDTGTSATIAIGTVVTGATGAAATVTNAGTTSAAVLNFSLPRGSPGLDGNNGNAATVAVGTVTAGAPGSAAAVVNGGTSSAASLNFTIPRGDVGNTGLAGTVAVGTVTTGAAGSAAAVANSGTANAATLNFTIPRGDTGIQGNAATLNIGTVTTGAPGSAASATNVGTTSAAVLNLTIPRGDAGANGGGSGTVTSVTGTAPIQVATGTSTPAISIDAATGALPGSMSATDKTKLNGVAPGATANSADAVLLARANHTGTQAAATITGLALVATTGLKADVGLGNADNISDVNKPVSTAQAVEIALKANSASPALTGTASIAGADNTLSLAGSATTAPVTFTATGTDANISINAVTKGTGVFLVNGQPLAAGSSITGYTYANRATLRSTSGTGFAYVEGLGLFQWVPGSTEPDEDETAFAATGGVWEMAATDPDYNFSDSVLRFDALQAKIAAAAKALYATFSMTTTLLANQSEVEFTVPITNAAIGNSVLVTPSNNWNLNNPNLTFFGYVLSAGVVNVAIKNGGFKATYLVTQSEYVGPTTSAMSTGTWAVAVFKP